MFKPYIQNSSTNSPQDLNSIFWFELERENKPKKKRIKNENWETSTGSNSWSIGIYFFTLIHK
jgi:hypothetical protein